MNKSSKAFAVFAEDISVNNARWHHRSFWFFLFLRGSQFSRLSLLWQLCKIGKRLSLSGTCCELPSSALVGAGIYIPHFNGIVISPYARLADGVKVLQQVTIGVNFEKDSSAAPLVGEGTLIGAGAKVIGAVNIGEGCRIGANAVVTRDVPDGKTVVGANRVLG